MSAQSMRNNHLSLSSGQSVNLAQKIGGGGEGTVYSLGDASGMLAKLYHAPVSPEKDAKLRAMIQMRSPELSQITAWPQDLILREGKAVGFVMPSALGAEEAHVLYGPKSRKAKFPDAGYSFLVHVCTNIARAFATIHKHKIVVGDINERVALITRQGTVRLIDCDSFQIATPSRRFLCEVGVPTFTPPELQTLSSFRGVRRTEQHDLFGLAVLIFHMLFLGRHPFAGRHKLKPDMTIETAIHECQFAYSRYQTKSLMQAPPNTPPLSATTDTLAELFETSFSLDAAQQKRERPSALRWAETLFELSRTLVSCSSNAAHAYSKKLAACPWCAVESTSRIELFNYVVPHGSKVEKLDVEAIWQALQGTAAVTLQPLPRVQEPSSQRNALSDEAGVLTKSLAARLRLQKAVQTKLVAEQGIVACEAEIEQAHVKVRDAKAFVDRYAADKTTLRQLESTLVARKRTLEKSQLLNRFLVWATVPAVGGALAVLHGTPYLAPGMVSPALLLLASHVFGSRQEALNLGLTSRTWELRRLVNLGIDHRIQLLKRTEHELSTARTRLTTAQGEHYRSLLEKTEAEAAQIDLRETEGAETKIGVRASIAEKRYADATTAYREASSIIATANQRWSELKDEAARVCGTIRNIETRRGTAVQKARDEARENQLADYLDGFFIAQEKWPRIPKSALSALASYGIETAADVERSEILKVPGFGTVRTQLLLDWQKQKASRFRFDPQKSDVGVRTQAANRRLDSERLAYERQLQKLLAQLNSIRETNAQRKSHIEAVASKAVSGLAAARAELRVVEAHRRTIDNAAPNLASKPSTSRWWKR